MYAIPADSFKSLADWQSLSIGGFPPRLATLPRKAAMYILYDLTHLNEGQIAMLDRAREFLLANDAIVLNNWCGVDCKYNGDEKKNEQLLFEVLSHFGCTMLDAQGLSHWTRGSSAIEKHSFRDWRDIELSKVESQRVADQKKWWKDNRLLIVGVVIQLLNFLAYMVIEAAKK